MISLENLWRFSYESATVLSLWIRRKSLWILQGISGKSLENQRRNFPVDSRFTHNPNFSGDSPPPRIHHPQGFPAESARFCPLGNLRDSDHHIGCITRAIGWIKQGHFYQKKCRGCDRLSCYSYTHQVAKIMPAHSMRMLHHSQVSAVSFDSLADQYFTHTDVR